MDSILIAQRKQRLIWGAAALLIAMLGLAQRDQRGFLPGPDAPAVSAFVAITPQAPGAIGDIGTVASVGRRPLGRASALGDPQVNGISNVAAPGTGATPSVFDAPASSATPSALLALADPNSGVGINFGPGVGGVLPGLSPGAPQQTVSSGATPGAVPEAPIWVIMILGVGGVGCLARRERARGRPLFKPQVA